MSCVLGPVSIIDCMCPSAIWSFSSLPKVAKIQWWGCLGHPSDTAKVALGFKTTWARWGLLNILLLNALQPSHMSSNMSSSMSSSMTQNSSMSSSMTLLIKTCWITFESTLNLKLQGLNCFDFKFASLHLLWVCFAFVLSLLCKWLVSSQPIKGGGCWCALRSGELLIGDVLLAC